MTAKVMRVRDEATPREQVAVPARLLELARSATRITVLTGAGMSAESGVPTFRDAQTGLWEEFDPMRLATPEAWAEDPALVWAWYCWRATLVSSVEPNAGHRALAAWSARPGVDLRIVTQNVDDLHERAGSVVLAHLHGSLFATRCDSCGRPADTEPGPLNEQAERIEPPRCPRCGGQMRPGAVWFGEMLPAGPLERAERAVEDSDLVVVVGSSGAVYPAAVLPNLALGLGIPVAEINIGETELSQAADVSWRETAARALPALVGALHG